jgi:decaprenyl-phosphate phosphoribosyltransferase
MRTLAALIKPRYHASFLTVSIAALLFAPRIDAALWRSLAVLYLSFNVLLYGGIYTFNDIADRVADARHPRKRTRPVASGRLSVGRAAAIGCALCCSGLAIAVMLYPPRVLACFAAIMVLNAAYSFGGRDLRVVDVALNSMPHAVRFVMGVLLVGRTPPAGHIAAWLCLAIGVSCVRRVIEKESDGERSRPVLGRYSAAGLSTAADFGFLPIAVLALIDAGRSPGFYAIALPAYLLIVVSARRVSAWHVGLERLWLR